MRNEILSKCPKCEKLFTFVNANKVDIHGAGGKKFVGVAYCCPFCQTAITVDVDPMLFKNDIANAVKGPRF